MPFELAIDPGTPITLAVVASLVSFIDAIAGGGGLLTIPALLITGVPPHLVLGTNKLSSTFGAAAAGYISYRCKLFHLGKWRNVLLTTAISAAIGAWTAHLLPAEWLNRMSPVVVSARGLYMLFDGAPKAPLDADAPVGRKCQWPQSLTLSFYDGMVGLGTGVFWTVGSLLVYPLDLARVSGVVRSMNFVSNIVALAVFVASDQVIWSLGLCTGASLMVGAYFGARTAIGGGVKFIRLVFILVILALTTRLVWQHWLSGA